MHVTWWRENLPRNIGLENLYEYHVYEKMFAGIGATAFTMIEIMMSFILVADQLMISLLGIWDLWNQNIKMVQQGSYPWDRLIMMGQFML